LVIFPCRHSRPDPESSLFNLGSRFGEVIEKGIGECNKMSEFLFPDYYVTNVKKPTPEEISKYLEEISHEEK